MRGDKGNAGGDRADEHAREAKIRSTTIVAARGRHSSTNRAGDLNRNVPESPAPVIAKRLREFLAISADVDFAATLTPRNGKMVFENAAYESKPGQWKMCYRAGKEATIAARAAVQAWLKELGG